MKRKYVHRPETAIKKITKIRAKNNSVWMNLLLLACQSRPKQAKQIVSQIIRKDQEVTKWMKRLVA